MRIAVISLFKQGFGGGSGRVAHEMARQFAIERDVALICPGEGTELHIEENGLRVLSVQSVGERHACVPRLSRKNINAMFDFLDAFRPDIIHAHEPASLSLMGQIWAKMRDVPFVYTAHVLPSHVLEFGAADAFSFANNPVTETAVRAVFDNFLRNCDALIALNRPALVDIRASGYEGDLFTIHNGRDLSTFDACPIADVTSPLRVLTFVGFICERKNQRYLVEVLRHLPANYCLRLVGEAMEADYERELQSLADGLGLGNVVFAGPVTFEEIPRHLQETHVFVSASRMEVQSLVIIEALASGTPVVGLANETVDELVDAGVGGRVPSDASPEVFARRVAEICNLPPVEYERMCGNARQRVAHLDWSTVRDMTVRAYERIASARPDDTVTLRAQLAGILDQIRSTELGEIVAERLPAFRHRPRPHGGHALFPFGEQASRVSGATWFYAGLTRVVSTGIISTRAVSSTLTHTSIPPRLFRMKGLRMDGGRIHTDEHRL